MQDLYHAMGAACGCAPWVLPSAGGSPAICLPGRAAGFLAVRAVWWDALAACPDAARVRQALQHTALPCLQRLRDIVAHEGRPWRAEVAFDGIHAEGQRCALRSGGGVHPESQAAASDWR